ncbi:delta adaptin [Cavenderia fasciculata]|uniref:AP-3 complex subunit delta n=1 Tax=Cavenderia fasciculata TaxID=261658 RepID=F4PKU9_CACFS|nr:delta adaptin [Cavenderia fasciculata]EGG24223.1 delta adaptin [Cavenderia fasciculata]|eukprot:XP_004362074.1 delta adaptin [Cavenderia fasciculata]
MFERTLADLVRGIRNHKKNEDKFISQCIQEIKEELRGDMSKKALAIQKLTYITMLGYDISWASFNIVEVMSSAKFSSKRIGYLAASQSFHEGTEVITLATNQIRKDFLSNNQYEAYLALNCLSNICTPDLARDLANDLITLLSTQKTHILKRTILVMYKVFLRYPEALRPAFPRLKEKLEDPEPAVMSCAVNVICELARKNPKNYLTLAPVLFKILTNSTTNYWMYIKIVKLFGALTPLEPRLGKKLIDPLTNIINTSSSMSLLFECIQTCIIGIPDNLPLMKLCISKLRTLIEHPDQNLKYLGLLALNNIMKIYPKAVSEHREVVLGCLDDEDISIRQRALDLLSGMVTKKNLPDIAAKLLRHIETAEGSYRDRIVEKIVELCALGTYQYVTDFEWYINTLIQLSEVSETAHGPLIASQLLDVTIRVRVVRSYATKQMIALLKSPKLMANPKEGGICEVLYAAAWIVGEFAAYVNNPVESLEAFLQPRVSVLPAHVQSVYMLNALKVFAHASAEAATGGEHAGAITQEERDDQTTVVECTPVDASTVEECLAILHARLPLFTQSIHIDVQERACLVSEILKFYGTMRDQGNDIAGELVTLFTEALNPVAPKAQKKVPVPEGLDLDAWINDPKLQVVDSDTEDSDSDIFGSRVDAGNNGTNDSGDESERSFDISRAKEERIQRNASNPYMLGGGKKTQKSIVDEEMTHIPVAALPANLGPVIVGGKMDAKKKKPKKFTIDTTTEMPENARPDSDDESSSSLHSKRKQDALSSININEPLTASDVLPVARHRSDIQREKEMERERELAAQRAAKRGASSSAKSPQSPTASVYTDITSPEVQAKGGKKSAKSKSAAAPAPAPVVVKKAPAVYLPITLENCEYFTLSFELTKVDQPPQPATSTTSATVPIKLSLKVQNKSDEDLSEVLFTLVESQKDKITVTGKSSAFDIGVLEAGSNTTISQTFNLATNTIIPQLTLKLTGTSSESIDIDIDIPIPMSFFIVKTKISKDKFAEILQKSASMASASVKVPSITIQKAIEILADQLNIEVVQCHPSGSTASFYARTNQNQHIAMLAKDRDGVTSFDIKSSDSSLAQLLVKQLSTLFLKQQQLN